jgi:uncharacterized protein YegP (UPF0339 family)
MTWADRRRTWRWKLIAANGVEVAQSSQAFCTRGAATHSILALKRLIPKVAL